MLIGIWALFRFSLLLLSFTGKNISVQDLLDKGKICSVILGCIPKKIPGS